jgi:RNAse (barnase) inhibitor barstar
VVGAGWNFVLLDTTRVHDKAGFLDVCATAFDLPRWFGRNWDALADSLSDRSTGEPEVVLWEGWRELLDHDRDTVDVALQIFSEDAKESGQLRVFLREADDVPDLVRDLPVL